jgi:hypothetical protein
MGCVLYCVKIVNGLECGPNKVMTSCSFYLAPKIEDEEMEEES